MKHDISLKPIEPVTPIESDGLSNHWYGLSRYPGQTHPRFSPNYPGLVKSIPAKAEADKAQEILTEFGAALAQFEANNPLLWLSPPTGNKAP